MCQDAKIRPFLGPIDQENTDFFCSFASVVGKTLEMVFLEQMEEQSVNHILNQGSPTWSQEGKGMARLLAGIL